MHTAYKVALITALLLSVDALRKQYEASAQDAFTQCLALVQSGQPLPQNVINYCQNIFYQTNQEAQRQIQQARCSAQVQQRTAEASARVAHAENQRSFCQTDSCRDYWRIKEAEAREEFDRAVRGSNALNCFR